MHKTEADRPRARYRVCTEGPGGREEIGSGIDLPAEIAFAERHHRASGHKTWVWDMRTGKTVHRLAADHHKIAEAQKARAAVAK